MSSDNAGNALADYCLTRVIAGFYSLNYAFVIVASR